MPSNARKAAGRRSPGDEGGQMMILAAVLLVIGLIALAGMVARVNQLGSQTAVEADKAILGEVTPVQDAIDGSLSALLKRTFAGTITGSTTITATTPTFADTDVGLNITGPGLPPAGARIASVSSSTVATLTNSATSGTFTLFKPGFALDSGTYVRAEDAVVGVLEQLQRIEASHGFWMDYQITCIAANPNQGQVVVHLSDGSVWVELRSTVMFPRNNADCSSIVG